MGRNNDREIELKRDTTLVGARRRRTNFPVEVYDDGDGPIWLFGFGGHSTGPDMIIRARNFETAWEIAIDESATIPESEVPEAYGFYGENAALELRQADERANAGIGEYPALQEGYEYQSNASGTGIVDVGHYAWLREMTREDCENVRLVIRTHDEPSVTATFELRDYAYAMIVKDTGEIKARGKRKWFDSYDLCANVGERILRLERAFGTVNTQIKWKQAS